MADLPDTMWLHTEHIRSVLIRFHIDPGQIDRMLRSLDALRAAHPSGSRGLDEGLREDVAEHVRDCTANTCCIITTGVEGLFTAEREDT